MDELIILLDQYSSLTDSFERVLNINEVEKIGSLVESITNPSDKWYSIERIHKHIISLVDNAEDVNIPYCYNVRYEYYYGNKYITNFQIASRRQHIQTPFYTIEYAQGDYEDQAILEYAMIKYYENEIHGIVNATYFAEITLGDGNGHAAIFLPVENGKICILDPAGFYYTSQNNKITSRSVSQELLQYANRWTLSGGISNIDLYEIDITDGSYSTSFSGTLNEIMAFFAGDS